MLLVSLMRRYFCFLEEREKFVVSFVLKCMFGISLNVLYGVRFVLIVECKIILWWFVKLNCFYLVWLCFLNVLY